MSDERATWADAIREASRPPYGRRARWGPYSRQAVRLIGRTLEQLGQRLDSWSWGWRQ